MRRCQLPITALQAYSKLNDITFLDVGVEDLGVRGFGLVAKRSLSSEDTFDSPTLLLVPYDLVLCGEAIEEHAKVDQHFRQLRDVVGGKVSHNLTLENGVSEILIKALVFEG
jgi:hypothetical protein